MKEIWLDYYKVLNVIDSCKTVEQLNSSSKMLGFWLDKHLDYQIYLSTFKDHIEKKFKELDGKEINTISFRGVTVY